MKELTKERLEKAGWHINRKIDVESIRILYKERGFILINIVESFLVEYGMLKINFPKKGSPFNTIEEIDFNPFTALGKTLNKDYFERIQEEFPDVLEVMEEEFYPVGNVARGNMILLLTNKGKFFSYTDGCLVKNGESVNEMLDCVIGESKMPIIYD